jgi:hypothetical protein
MVEGAAGVGIRVSGAHGDGTRSAGFGGLQSCGSVWACTVCSAKVAARRQVELTDAMTEWERRGGGFVAATFTMRHRRGQSLKSLWDALSDAWSKATGGRGWKDDQALWGFAMPRLVKTGRRAGETVHDLRIPIVKVVEVTTGPNGWHVHVHAVLFLQRPVTDATAEVIGDRMFNRWTLALVRNGFEAPTREHGVEAHAVSGEAAAEAFGEYFTKGVYDGVAGAALETTRGDLKGARGDNRTPFTVLRGIAGHADYAEGDAELWAEWERGSRGRRQMTWTPGLRELLALDVEQTDEEIAAEEHGGETLLVIDPDDWHRKVAPVRGMQALLLDLAESDDTGFLLLACLQLEGIAWDWPRGPQPGPPPLL